MAFVLPNLPYNIDALEPYIDSMTMEIHHGKHHQAYINNLNKAISDSGVEEASIEHILNCVSKHSEVVRNNGGGHYNHSFFWKTLSPTSAKQPIGNLSQEISKRFGGFEEFKRQFSDEAGKRFGSGWAWLFINTNGMLDICSTANQDNPLMDVVSDKHRGTPLLGLDVWEHAYYLKYQNQRPKYIEAFWNVIDWEAVEERFVEARF